MKAFIDYRLNPMNPRPYTARAYVETAQSTFFYADSASSFGEAKTKVLDKIRKLYIPVPEPEEIEIE